MDHGISEAELEEMEARALAATDAPWHRVPNAADLAPDTLYEGRRSARMDAGAQAS